jgi:hypothetical protein
MPYVEAFTIFTYDIELTRNTATREAALLVEAAAAREEDAPQKLSRAVSRIALNVASNPPRFKATSLVKSNKRVSRDALSVANLPPVVTARVTCSHESESTKATQSSHLYCHLTTRAFFTLS